MEKLISLRLKGKVQLQLSLSPKSKINIQLLIMIVCFRGIQLLVKFFNFDFLYFLCRGIIYDQFTKK
jgi:hypothetical protein